jgi:tRNA pseudouridine32 synthase/23S rRNA pseudouridine746 synthase
MQLTPITGRSHQLRLHMKMLGHPILGDNLYADTHSLKMSQRLLLHACFLSFTHPTGGQKLAFEHLEELTSFITGT